MSDQVPPQNVEAEASVLGAMLVATAAVVDVEQTGLGGEDFYLDRHRLLFRCIAALRARSEAVDEITVRAALQRAGKLEEAGGKHYVSELAAKVPAAGNACHYAEIVRDLALDRRKGEIGLELRNGLAPAEAIEQLRTLVIRGANGAWLGSAAALLSQPDPGPTPMLVERLLVRGAIGEIVGAYKRGKTWLALDIAISVAAGRPLFGELEVMQGPVILVLEESGERALHRRLGMLLRGRAIAAGEIGGLHFAANARVRLDDPAWRARLLTAAQEVKPALIVLDPLVRLKGAADENSQAEMAPVLDFIRDLRDASGGAVVFTHHTGHDNKGRSRGTSDIEGYWESRIVLSAEEGSPLVQLEVDHREAESGGTLSYRRVGDEVTDSLRLVLVEPPADAEEDLAEQLLSAMRFEPGRGTEALARAVEKRPAAARPVLEKLKAAGTAYRAPSRITDGAGRPRKIEGWFAADQSQSQPVPIPGTGTDGEASEGPGRPTRPGFSTPDGGRVGFPVPAEPDATGDDGSDPPEPPESLTHQVDRDSGRTPRAREEVGDA